MKSPQEIAEDQKQLAKGREKAGHKTKEKDDHRLWILRLASNTLRFLKESTFKVSVENQKDYSDEFKGLKKAVLSSKTEKVEVTNLPKEIKVSNLKEIKIPEVKIPQTIIPDNKKELQSIEKAVKGIKIPEVNIPETKVDFSDVIKEVKSLQKALSGLKLEVKETVLDQTGIETRLDSLSGLLEALNAKEVTLPSDRTDEVLTALFGLSQAIKEIEFPVPNFSSSWQHSLTMQSDDLAKTIAYKTVNGKEVVDYFEFVGVDGETYRKTFNYRLDGKATGWTGWEKQ